MPSGPVIRDSMNASSVCPDTFSTTAPSRSMLMPYLNDCPGCCTSGSFAARSRKAAIVGACSTFALL
jgi:hypothetical protein